MKKNIKYILALAVAPMMLASCDDMLNKHPQATLSPETFFTNESEMMSFSNSFYTIFPSTGLYNENCDNYIGIDLISEIRDGRVIPGSGSGWSFTDLRKFNTLLDYSGNCKDEKVRNRYVGLARFFRAYFYFEKVKKFGDVPWYDTQLGSKDDRLYKARDTREFVMGKMLEDIDFAIANLPETRSVYTVTKWTALALKSRFCLFEGTYRKYHEINGYEHDWKYYLELSAAASAEFMNKSGYTLHTKEGANGSYQALFTSDNALSDEVILARDYNGTSGIGVTHNSTNYTLVAGMGRPGMTKKIVDSYLMKDGTRFTDQPGHTTMQFADEMKNRDPRLAQTIRTPGYSRTVTNKDGSKTSKQYAPDLSVSVTGYQPIKYVYKDESSKDAYNASDMDLIIFRTAEIYLNYAEAKAELGTLTQGDIDISVKKLRDRVGMPNLDMAAANLNPDPYLASEVTGYANVKGENKGVILEIRRERTIELAQEGFRYYDMMRWKEGKRFEQPLLGMYFPGPGEYDLDGNGTMDICLYEDAAPSGSKATLKYKLGTDIILSQNTKGNVMPHAGEGKWDEERDYLYPIPTDDRSLTHGNLTQNPGWYDGLEF